ncbi:MAG: HlyD family efflux transporter periplasmic adaptor subunit [Planctomycetales bacterium]|nr:HlyD family efflux transporter periplasmic adaptor subunit [Planctomycetales bacterium]
MWTSPAIVQYSPPAVLRARSSGMVAMVHVSDGQIVSVGSPIITIRNDDLTIQLGRKKKELAQVEQEILAAQWSGNAVDMADAEARKAGLQQQIGELQIEVDQLVLRAPVDGTVISRSLALMHGTFVKPGDEVAVVGREDSKRLKVSISQSEARDAQRWQDQPVRVIVNGQSTWTQQLTRIETRASTTPPDDSLIAVNAGSLPAIQQEGGYVLSEPRVNAFIELTPAQSKRLRCGQRASVHLASDKPTIGQYLLSRVWGFVSY